jgi:predicted lysophospholipase L1 biosynthesis ABC-type transport system permease subunit
MGVGLGAQSSEISLVSDLVPDTEVRPAYPLEMLGVELQVELPDGALGIGTLTIDDLAVSAGGASTSIDVASLPTFTADIQSAVNGFGPAQTTPVDFNLGTPAPAGEAVPVLASEEYLELTGAAVGDVVELGQLTERRQFEIIGSLRGFPTLDPAQPFVIADLGALASAEESEGGQLRTAEWWLDTDEDAGPAIATTLRADPYSTDMVVVRDELHRDLLSDPVALGVIGALALGALSAIVFAAIGFIVSATVSTRERLGEFALLQAMGLSHRQLSAWLTMENAFLLAIGLLAGTGLGLILAWVVLPFVTLTQEATLAVPPVEVVIPWGVYGLLYLVALGALVVTVVVIGQLLRRVRVSGVLRSGGE